jgi:hypothetical protein
MVDHVFTCLHCEEPFVISLNEFNCRILRHGVYKHNLQPINPHATKEECGALLRDDAIYGCAGPLQIIAKASASASASASAFEIRICDYI